jgi:hypothetical protein
MGDGGMNARLYRGLSQPNLALLQIGKTLAAAYHPTIEESLPSALTALVRDIESREKTTREPIRSEMCTAGDSSAKGR